MLGPTKVMSTPGQPTKNAFAESFIKTVRCEGVYVHYYRTFEEAQEGVCRPFLKTSIMPNVSPHSSLDYVPPDEFESQFALCSRLSGLDFLGALQLSLMTAIPFHLVTQRLLHGAKTYA
jgi:hypothetical protein